jgi:hypothetical protein
VSPWPLVQQSDSTSVASAVVASVRQIRLLEIDFMSVEFP